MKQVAILMIVVGIFLGTGGGAFAQQRAELKTTRQALPFATGPSEKYRMGGIIKDIDPAGLKISIQQHQVKRDRTVTLNLDKRVVKDVAAFAKGDAINVWVRGNTVTGVEKIPNPLWEEIRRNGA